MLMVFLLGVSGVHSVYRNSWSLSSGGFALALLVRQRQQSGQFIDRQIAARGVGAVAENLAVCPPRGLRLADETVDRLDCRLHLANALHAVVLDLGLVRLDLLPGGDEVLRLYDELVGATLLAPGLLVDGDAD